MVFRIFRNIALPVLIMTAGSAQATYVGDFVNVKGYYDTTGNQNNVFNYSDRPVRVSTPTTGVNRVVFEELAKWSYSPTLQVTPHMQGLGGHYSCSGNLTVEGLDLVALVTCKRNGQPTAGKFSLLILDSTSDSAYAAVPACPTCAIPGFSFNPWAKSASESTSDVIRREYPQIGRSRVFFRNDSPERFHFDKHPIAVVTAASSDAHCQVFSFGISTTQPNEVGAEIRCFNSSGQPLNAAYHLAMIPPANRTAYVWVSNDQQTPRSYLFNDGATFTSEIEVSRDGLGRYTVRLPGLANLWSDAGAVKVSSHGVNGEACGITNFGMAGTTAQVSMSCYAPNGQAADTRLTVLMTSRN